MRDWMLCGCALLQRPGGGESESADRYADDVADGECRDGSVQREKGIILDRTRPGAVK